MSPSPSRSPSASPSRSGGGTTPSPSLSHTPSRSTSTFYETVTAVPAGDDEELPKTGDGFVAPLTMLGAFLVVGGAFTLRAARRGGYVTGEL
ncbi:hypothetical protein Aph01nite_01610 [Acrocarpospora phusangensis]|uniref:Uncharacterized protein n=1 Tax=Acrocarpospora phusangensis TaxID=1070424 RepID=A0A919Q495_9ACTN|nr:hypothetical protein Aph01nite_01610 [Acrocarpospora phusangensis]